MRLSLFLAGTVIAGLAWFEVMMQPSGAERVELGVILTGMALLALAAAQLLPRLAQRLGSIRHAMTLLGIAGFGIVVIGALAVAKRMFLSEHDLQLLLVVLGFGALATSAFAVGVSRPLASDIDKLSEKAELVTRGVLDPEIPIQRKDEVGRLANALETMIDRLDEAETARLADQKSRRAFFSSVGHDLRTPLASLRASVEAIQDGLAETSAESLSVMEHDIDAMTSLVDDLNLLARLDSGSLEVRTSEVDITEIADEAIDVLRPLARSKGISLRLAADARVIAMADAGHLGRVFRNVLDNAVRHSPETGEITIEVSQQNGSAVVMITDEGPGFDPEFAESAFDRFTRAEPSRKRDGGGSGLGLAIVEGLVTALDGRVWIETGRGGRVGIELPADRSPAQHVGHP